MAAYKVMGQSVLEANEPRAGTLLGSLMNLAQDLIKGLNQVEEWKGRDRYKEWTINKAVPEVEYICWLMFFWLQIIENSNWCKLTRGVC